MAQACPHNVGKLLLLAERLTVLILNLAIVIRPEEIKSLLKLANPLALLYAPAFSEKIEAIRALCAENNGGVIRRLPYVEITTAYPEGLGSYVYEVDPSTEPELPRPGSLFFTSGTSGNQKGVVHSYQALLASARERIVTWKLTEQDGVLNQKPGNWMGGIFGIIPSLMSGACL